MLGKYIVKWMAMMANKYFHIKELVSKKVYEVYKDTAKYLLDPLALKVLENVREILGVPLICNNWARGGNRQYCGFREKGCGVGTPKGWHYKGKAFDLISKQMSAKDMWEKLEKNKHLLICPIRIEKWEGDKEITWLHFDLGDTKGKKIYFFRA